MVARSEVSTMNESDLTRIWNGVLADAGAELGREAIESWLRKVNLTAIDGHVATLTAESPFYANHVERHPVFAVCRLFAPKFRVVKSPTKEAGRRS